MVDVADKIVYFQAITGLQDLDLCTEILSAHGWDLEQAISTFTSSSNSTNPSSNHNTNSSTATAAAAAAVNDVGSSGQFDTATYQEDLDRSGLIVADPAPPGLAWKLITLPFSIVSGSLRLISGAIGLGIWAAGGVLSYSLGMHFKPRIACMYVVGFV